MKLSVERNRILSYFRLDLYTCSDHSFLTCFQAAKEEDRKKRKRPKLRRQRASGEAEVAIKKVVKRIKVRHNSHSLVARMKVLESTRRCWLSEFEVLCFSSFLPCEFVNDINCCLLWNNLANMYSAHCYASLGLDQDNGRFWRDIEMEAQAAIVDENERWVG